MRRSPLHQYDNRAFESDPSNVHVQPVNGQTSRPTSRISEIEVGRTKLHRLLDEVLDKAEPDSPHDPDSESERKYRRQRRRMHSAPFDPRNPLIHNDEQQIPHIPMIANVAERPDPSLLRVYNNPYQAGDEAYQIQRAMPVVLQPKYASDDSSIPNRYMTTADIYGSQRQPDIDRNGLMRPYGQRQHRFDDDAVYIDTMPKSRDGARVPFHNNWTDRDNRSNDNYFHLDPSDLTNDFAKRNDYRDEYMMAKRSVVSTKNLLSSIQDELQQIVSHPSTDSYHA